VFYSLLNQSGCFTMLLGTSETSWYTNPDGSMREGRTRLPGRTGKSFCYRFDDEKTGNFAVLSLPHHREHCCRTHIQNLWVDEKWERLGIATRAMKALQKIAGQVDEMCADETSRHKELTLQCEGYSLWLAPNPFWTQRWSDGKEDSPRESFLTEIDWANPSDFEKDMVDDGEEILDPDLTRMDWKQLREFYRRLDFVEVDGLDYVEEWNEQYLRVVRVPLLYPRSLKIGRRVMIWPPTNADTYMKEEE